MTTIKDDFTYRDFSGKRHPRRFVVAAAIILAVLAVLGLAAVAVNANRQASFNARMTELAGVPPTLNIPTPTPTDIPTATPEPSPTVDPCTYDTSYWSLTPIEPAYTGSPEPHLYRLPECAYEGLKKAVAFTLLRSSGGWIFPELYQALGHDYGYPYPYIAGVLVNTETQSDVWYSPITQESPFYNRAWDFDPATRENRSQYVLSGCYKDVRIYIQPPGEYRDLPYGCTVAEFIPYDPVVVLALEAPDEKHLKAFDPSLMSNYPNVDPKAAGYKIERYYGYLGNGVWMYLGFNKHTIQSYPTREQYDMNLQVYRLREPALPPMDLAWVEQEFGLAPKPVPWEVLDVPAEVNEPILKEIYAANTRFFRTVVIQMTSTP